MCKEYVQHAGLKNHFWVKAVATANYLKNRSPTKVVEQKIPEEMWTGKKPTVTHLCIFGCVVHVFIPNEKHQKLDAKSIECILLGYSEITKHTVCTSDKLNKSL